MTNPILVEVTRGGFVESRHRGAIAIVDGAGKVVHSVGDIEQPVFPRSAIKLIQALPLVESGAADAYKFSNEALALACASHNAEKSQVDTAATMLAAAGLDDGALECGPQPPRKEAELAAYYKSGATARRIDNNCSGKHAGMLAFARHSGIDHHGYSKREHDVQRAVGAALEEMTGASLADAPCGVDGCSIPTCALPLHQLARGFARIATQQGLAPKRAQAVRKLMDACFAAPFMVAGTGRFCTDIMGALPGRAFVKTGAEGVFCAAFPELGLGVALKCDDGISRASETMMAHVIADSLSLSDVERAKIAPRLAPQIANWVGDKVGEVRAVSDFAALLHG